MLRLNDFVVARKRFYDLSRGLFISASKHCRKMELRDFMTCRERFNVQSDWSISQLWNTVGR